MTRGALAARTAGVELMDEPGQDPRERARSLADLRAVNRWLGGTRQVLRLVGDLTLRVPATPVRLLDVATGSADLPLALTRWARRCGIDLRVTATDLHPSSTAVARRYAAADAAVTVLPADALDLPYPDGAFHLAMCNTALHHFDADGAERVLREMRRVATHGLVVTDLRRSHAALLGARFLAGTVWRRHPVTRHDGPLSVRRAFSAAELRALAVAAGLAGARVRTDPVFRLSLTVADPT